MSSFDSFVEGQGAYYPDVNTSQRSGISRQRYETECQQLTEKACYEVHKALLSYYVLNDLSETEIAVENNLRKALDHLHSACALLNG